MFLGYQNGTKGYVMLDIKSREIFVSRDVSFYEKVFPYANQIDPVYKKMKHIRYLNLITFLNLSITTLIILKLNKFSPALNLKFKTSLIL